MLNPETLNWDDLRVFLALARDPRLGAAAKSLAVDPTTMSRRLARLSETVDATLFEQSGGRHLLTDRGKQLLESAEKVEAAILEARDTGHTPLSGLIKIAVPESLATWFIGPRLHTFQDANPGTFIDLISPSVYPDPLKREVDIAILPARPQRGPLTTKKIASFTVQLYTSQKYLDSHGQIESVDDLASHRFIGYTRDLLRNEWYREYHRDYLRNVVPGYVVHLRATSMSVQAALLSSGSGIGLLPHYVASHYPALRPVLELEVRLNRSFWLVVREDVRKSPRVDRFLKWFSQLVDENRSFFRGPSPGNGKSGEIGSNEYANL